MKTTVAGRRDIGPPVRVLYLLPNLGFGGVEQSVLLMVRSAEELGLEVSVATLFPPSGPPVVPELKALGVDPHVIGPTGGDGGIRAWGRAVRRLARLCGRLGVDVVDSCYPLADLVGRFACAGSRRRHVVHLVTTGQRERSRGRGRDVHRLLARTGAFTSGYVAVSAAAADDAIREQRIPSRRIAVIPRGVDLEDFPPQPPRSTGPLRLLSVSRLVPQKGLETAVRAVALARTGGLDVTLTLAGHGPFRESLQALASDLRLDGAVRLVGPTRAVAALHRDHDAFVLPSRFEGLSNSVLEAMASARPVIVSDIPALREEAGESALTFPVGDEAGLAGAIRRLAEMTPAERRRRGSAARRRAEERYDTRVLLPRLAGYYRDVKGTGGERVVSA